MENWSRHLDGGGYILDDGMVIQVIAKGVGDVAEVADPVVPGGICLLTCGCRKQLDKF